MNGEHGRRFHLEINSLEDFAAFVALVRGEDLTDEKLLEMTTRLNKATKKLSDAETADSGHKP